MLFRSLCFATAAISWNIPNPILMFTGMGIGTVLALVTIFRPTMAATTAPIYAASQGLFLGGITVLFEAQFPGIAIQAIGLTFGTLVPVPPRNTTGDLIFCLTVVRIVPSMPLPRRWRSMPRHLIRISRLATSCEDAAR